MSDDVDPTAQGLLRCLQALADEAAILNLARTFAALQKAVAACAEESGLSHPRATRRLAAALVH